MDANITPPDGQHEYTVGEAASLHGLTVRTLHHWEQRGLLNPAHDEFNGYRYYTDTDLERITVIMGYRAIGMSLDAIRNILQDQANSTEHLLAQRDMLQRKIAAYGRMLETIEHLLEDTMAPKNEQLSAAEKAEIMGEGFSLAHQQEAQERYGKTDDWAEYQRRTASMDRADWQNGKQQVDEVEQALVEAFNRGVQPGSEEANALAERHRASLFFFEVTPAKHVILARGYVEDARFNEHYEKLAAGLAVWLRDIIYENARAHGLDPENVTWC